jgi:hypothetical protein
VEESAFPRIGTPGYSRKLESVEGWIFTPWVRAGLDAPAKDIMDLWHAKPRM